MDKELNNRSLLFGVPGIALQIVGQVIRLSPGASPGTVVTGVVIVCIGTALLICGLCLYAQSKGHSGWWGLMGLLSLLGLIVLAVLPDKRK